MDTPETKSFNKNNLNKHSILNYKVDKQMTSLTMYYTDSNTLQTNLKNSTSMQISQKFIQKKEKLLLKYINF